MDSFFFLGEGDLATFVQDMMHSYGCTYICLWSYYPHPSNCLRYKDGLYRERSSQQPSSSSGSLAQRLFIEYGRSIIIVDSSHIPGRAFLNNFPYMELQSADLRRMASSETQRQFYQEAGIKTAIFMGCNTGEIELGFSGGTQVNVEMEMRTRFPNDFSRPLFAPTTSGDQLPQQASTDQNRPASSSSSLRSLSYDSPEYSPLLFDDVLITSYTVPAPQREAMVQQPLGSTHPPVSAATSHQQAIRALSRMRNIQLLTIEGEDAAMTQAILAVISSPASSSSSLQQSQQNLPHNYPVRGSQASAFRWYRSALAPRIPISTRIQRTNMLKRSITFLRTLYSMRFQEQMQAGWTSSNQLHHMIAERRRREKLNESFQALRSLLPPGTKKDKASVLRSTTEFLSSLTAQVAELSKRNQILEAQLLPKKSAAAEEGISGGSSNERVEVQITPVGASTSSLSRIVDLQVIIRAEVSMVDLVVGLLEFLKTDQNVSLMSVEANPRMAEATSISNVVLMRLRIEDGEWDESAFQEAIRRLVTDLAQ